MQFQFLFEMSKSQNYVGVLADSALVRGHIASQNAGSSNPGLYYQVGGLGVNGFFATALGNTLQTSINKDLVKAYDKRFGESGSGAWKQDQTDRTIRLTSLNIPLPSNAHSDGHSVGANVRAMIYSVGPILGDPPTPEEPPVLDHGVYRQIYIDAFSEVAAANKASKDKIDAIRLTMVSTGIYGGTLPDEILAELCHEAASIILEAVEAAAKLADAAHLPKTMLINNSAVAPKLPNKEKDAFSAAAKDRGIDVDKSGFTLDVTG